MLGEYFIDIFLWDKSYIFCNLFGYIFQNCTLNDDNQLIAEKFYCPKSYKLALEDQSNQIAKETIVQHQCRVILQLQPYISRMLHRSQGFHVNVLLSAFYCLYLYLQFLTQ